MILLQLQTPFTKEWIKPPNTSGLRGPDTSKPHLHVPAFSFNFPCTNLVFRSMGAPVPSSGQRSCQVPPHHTYCFS